MAIPTIITDPQNSLNSKIVDRGDSNALVVATTPLKTYENEVQFFISSTYGIDMNIGRTVDQTENIYNGGDSVYWTASVISGIKWTLSSTDQAHTGSLSLKYDNGNANDVVQFLNSGDLTLTNYNDLVIWIYVDKDWAPGDSVAVYGWDSGTSTKVGVNAALEDYFNFSNYDVWQQITIPLADMDLTGETLDALRVQIISEEGKSPKFYLDDIQFQGITGEVDAGLFKIEPELGTWYHVEKITIALADAYAGTVSDGTMAGLAYDQLLGVTALSSGILYQRIQDGEIEFTVVIKQLSDLIQIPGAILKNTISDGTNTFITIDVDYSEPIILKPENKDILAITINDNLSDLIFLRMYLTGKLEQRE